jgi:hypothetical protein
MNPNIETIERLYQSALKHFDMPEFNTFLADIQQDDNLMRFRESMSEYYDMPDFNTLKSDLFDLTTQPETEVQEAEVQQETNIDFDLAKKLATDIRNKNEEDDEVLLTEDELKSPIGSIDIFSDRVPEVAPMVSDQTLVPDIVNSQEIQQFETVANNPVLKAEADAINQDIQNKGGKYSIDNIDFFVDEEKQNQYKQAANDISEIYKDVEDIVNNVDAQEELLINTMLQEKARAYEESVSKGEAYELVQIGEGKDYAKEPKYQFEQLIEGKMPKNFDPAKWAIIEEWKSNGIISEASLNSFDDNVKKSVTNKIKKKKLNNYFHESDLDEDGRKYTEALLAEQTPGDIGYSDVLKSFDNPGYLDDLKLQNELDSEYILNEMKEINIATEKPFGDNEAMNKEYFDSVGALQVATNNLQLLIDKGVNANSPQAEIDEYNAAFDVYTKAKQNYQSKGFEDVYNAQAERIAAWDKERLKLLENTAELGDVSMAYELGVKNYSQLNRGAVNLAKAIVDATAGTVAVTAGFLGEGLEEVGGSAGMYEMSQFLQDIGGTYINAEKTFRERQEETFADPPKLGDVSFGEWAASGFADGIPSIVTVLSTIYGPSKFIKMGQKATIKKLKKEGVSQAIIDRTIKQQKIDFARKMARNSKLAQGAFFSMSYSQKGIDMALKQANAPEQIAKLRESLDAVNEDGTPLLNAFERQQALSEIAQLENVLDWNVLQKSGSALLAGSIEMYAERLGTLSYMKNLNRIAAPVKAGRFKKLMYQGLNSTINVGTELLEETATQIGNNLVDIHVLGEDKSIDDGLDKEFFSQVALTSLAIQGPQIGNNLYNMVQSEVLSKADVRKNERLFERLIEVEQSLQNPINPLTGDALTFKQLQALRQEKKMILESSAFDGVVNTQKFAQLSLKDKQSIFSLNQTRRKILKQLNELGLRGDTGSKAIKRQKAELVKEFKVADAQRNELLSKKQRETQEIMKDAQDPSLAAYNKGLYDFYSDVVLVQQGLNGNKYTKVNDETTVEELVEQGYDDAQARLIIDQRDAVLTNEDGTQVLDEDGNPIRRNDNATFIGNDIIVYDDNVINNLKQSVNKTDAQIASVSPIHELMHIQNRNQGLIKDNKLVSEVNQALDEAEVQLKQKLDLGQLTQEQYDTFINRKKKYTTDEGVDMEEVLNLFGDFTSTGILSRYDFSKINGLKFAIKNLLNRTNNKNFAFLFPIKNANDVYSYIDSFQRSAENQKLKTNELPEEDQENKLSVGASQRVQDLYDQQGEAAAFDIIEEFKPIVNKIVQRRSEAPGFDRQLLTDEIETGERGILDLIRDYDPDSGVPLAAYINKFLPARAIEASRRVLGEQFEEDVTEQRDLAAVEETDNEVVQKPKRKIKLKKRLTGTLTEATDKIRSEINNLPIEQLSFKTLKNIALEEVQKIFGIKPKPGNLTKQDVANAQQYINKNAEALITMLPEGATPSGTSTGVQKVLLDNFYTKTDRAKMSTTGSKAGLAIYEKRTNITPAEFKQVFGITPAGQPNLSDRNTSARIKAIVAQTERMLTNQEVREALEEQGKNIPQALIEGKTELMFSVGLSKPLTAKQKQIVERSTRDFELNQDYGPGLTNKKYWNDIVKYYGYEPINVNTLAGKEKLQAILFEGIDGREPLIRFLPKSFITLNRGTWSNGGMYETVKDEDGKPQPLTESEIKFLQDNGFRANDHKRLKRYKLKNGKTVLNNSKEFVTDEIQLQIMPGMRNNGNNRFIFANGLQIDEAIRRAEELAALEGVPAFAPENVNINLAVKRTGYRKLLKDGFTEEFKADQQNKRKGLKDILDVFNERIQADPNTYVPAIAAILSATSQSQGHFLRKGSIVEFVNDYGLKNVEEHTQPASFLGKFIFDRMIQNNYELYIDNALSTFFQGPLPEVNDKMLKGEGFDYTEAVDKQYRMDVLKGKIPIWVRYFNPFVNKQQITVKIKGKNVTFTGVDPNRLFLSNGNSIAQEYGVDIPREVRTPSTTAYQQELLFQIFTGQVTQEVAKQRLDTYVKLAEGLKQSKGVNTKALMESKVLFVNENMTSEDVLSKAATIDEALRLAKTLDAPIKKIRVFDFDDTLARSNSLVFYTMEDGTVGELTAEEFAEKGAHLVEQGAVMDFSDFDIVRDGQRGPLFNLAKKIKDARGNEDLFVLTARSPLSQDAIYEFLKSEGLEFKKENIIGLGNSTGEAKANWIIGKAAEGYNDFYFADDAIQNVKAVQDALSVIDVKSRVQQAKLKFSASLNQQFEDIIQGKSDKQLDEVLGSAKAKVLGASKGRFKFWIPYSAEDFVGLIYPTLAKGNMGNIQMAWYKRHLLNPFAKAMENLSRDRLQMMNDFRALKKTLNVPKNLTKTNETGFTNEQAIRVYLYNKMGFAPPGLTDKDVQEMVSVIENNPEFKVFADELLTITKGDGWVKPSQSWLAGTITTDLIDLLNTTKRDKYLEVFNKNVAEIYSEQNLNKLEAIFGSKYREALENMLQRMRTGKNRTTNNNRLSNRILNYINGANATIMFLNTRSAVLQTISAINYVNWSFNNPLKASQAFANQPQYWKDFMTLINSDYLRDRRNGLRINVTESEIADAAKTATNKAKAAIAYIMEKGYLPTQFADSFAIAAGGATFYRNRIKDLMKNEGLTEKAASEKALTEWKEISEESQQSSRPDKISQQQASDLGRLILMFGNTPMQYARLQKRAAQDLIAGRGDYRNNISRILYYGFVQNLIFNGLQQALFAVGFGDDEEEKDEKKVINTINGMSDSILRGLGIGGAAISVVKNFLLDLYERSNRSRPEYVDSVWKLTQFAPPISSKISRMRQAAWQFDSKKRREEIFEKGFSIDNPAFLAFAKVLSATTNLPLDRALLKYENIEGAFQEENEWWQSMAMLLGWPEWQLKQQNREYINQKKLPASKRIKSSTKSKRVGKGRVK